MISSPAPATAPTPNSTSAYQFSSLTLCILCFPASLAGFSVPRQDLLLLSPYCLRCRCLCHKHLSLINPSASSGLSSLCCWQSVIFNQTAGPKYFFWFGLCWFGFFFQKGNFVALFQPSHKNGHFLSAQLAGKHDSYINYLFYCFPSLCQPFCCQLHGTGPLFFSV